MKKAYEFPMMEWTELSDPDILTASFIQEEEGIGDVVDFDGLI